MLKKITTLVFSVIMILTIVPNEILASNHNDTTYRFNLTTHNDAKRTPARAKQNATSTYVNIEQAPAQNVYLQVEGYRPSSGSGSNYWTNETIGGRQVARRGQWLVRQLVYENGGRSARLSFYRHDVAGAVAGKWSPDSVGTYPRLN